VPRSAGIDRPAGVALAFQVSEYSVEPHEAVLACNLLAKDDERAVGADEAGEVRPEVAGVAEAPAASGGAERLAGAASGPDRLVVGPAGIAEGSAPYPDAGEEVDLGEPLEVVGSKVMHAPLVDDARCDLAGRDQVMQPPNTKWIDFIIVSYCHTRDLLASTILKRTSSPQLPIALLNPCKTILILLYAYDPLGLMRSILALVTVYAPVHA
jgi:hypothetical protein